MGSGCVVIVIVKNYVMVSLVVIDISVDVFNVV